MFYLVCLDYSLNIVIDYCFLKFLFSLGLLLVVLSDGVYLYYYNIFYIYVVFCLRQEWQDVFKVIVLYDLVGVGNMKNKGWVGFCVFQTGYYGFENL